MTTSPPPADRSRGEQTPARVLGIVSIALGTPAVAMPGGVNRLIGVKDDGDSRMWLRVVGARELVTAAGLLTRRRPVGWQWARVAGDVMDLTLTGIARARKGARTERVTATMGVLAGILAIDVLAATRLMRAGRGEDERDRLRGSITVRRPRAEVYAFWQDFENLPSFMAHVESVVLVGDGRTRWVAIAGTDRRMQWETEVAEFIPDELVAWRAVRGGDVDTEGIARFLPAPGGRGTEVRIEMRYSGPRRGRAGRTIARLFGADPQQQVDEDLRRFKQLMEAGEIVRSDGSPEGVNMRRLLRQRPAQPLPHPLGASADGGSM